MIIFPYRFISKARCEKSCLDTVQEGCFNPPPSKAKCARPGLTCVASKELEAGCSSCCCIKEGELNRDALFSNVVYALVGRKSNNVIKPELASKGGVGTVAARSKASFEPREENVRGTVSKEDSKIKISIFSSRRPGVLPGPAQRRQPRLLRRFPHPAPVVP